MAQPLLTGEHPAAPTAAAGTPAGASPGFLLQFLLDSELCWPHTGFGWNSA